MAKSALIFGYGYLGAPVARLWISESRAVYVVTRSCDRVESFPQPLQAMVADVTDESSLADLPAVDTVLFAVGYDRASDKSIEEVYVKGIENVLAALPAATKRLIYISTTGVYGDAQGDWIDEQTPTAPTRAGGKASLAAEQLIQQSPLADRAIILRLAGIYGPDRLPYLAKIKSGEPIEAPQSGHLNLIHVHDAARIIQLLSSPQRTISGPLTYCVGDGNPVVRGNYYREVARLLGAPEPQFTEPHPGSPRAARASADKRVSNRRLVDDLELELLYPDYRAGLAAIVGL